MKPNNTTSRSLLLLCILSLQWGCAGDPSPDAQTPFDRERWGIKEGASYTYRDQMVDAVLYSDTLRRMKRPELLEWLGKPDREQDGHLYYTILQNRLGFWTLNQESIVVKLGADNYVEWIKLHE